MLEEMAANEETKEKYLDLLNNATNEITNIKEQLGEQKEEVTHIGIVFGEDGTISYFAELEKTSEKQRERIEEAKEEKAEEDKAVQEKKAMQEKKKKNNKAGDLIFVFLMFSAVSQISRRPSFIMAMRSDKASASSM